MFIGFDEKELVSFGNYCFAQAKKSIKDEESDRVLEVTDADVRNWKETLEEDIPTISEVTP